MAIYATTLWLHYSIRYFGSTANSKARWRKNIRIPEKIVYMTKLSAFKSPETWPNWGVLFRIRPFVCKRQNQSGPKPFQISHESVTSSVSVNLITLSGVQYSM